MPKEYENKSIHNKDFLDSISNDYPDDYFDWKVTVQFYTSLHRCYCVLQTKEFDIIQNHTENIKNLKKINPTLSRKLYTLYKNSRQSRYDGFMRDDAMLRINKMNFESGTRLISDIESECLKYYPVAI